MFTLRLLGTASIESARGPLTGRAAQGRRLALLALLSLARGRMISRDKLIAVLWPEATPERARPQLSDALYILRGALGEDVVRAQGDGVALNSDAVTSDVALFERALEDGRLEEAAGLYAGPLLDGFHVPESVEFETWLSGERARLDRLFADTLEKLADSAATAAESLGWWRRRAAQDPCNGRVALRLMQALEAAGDRAGALQHARIHAMLLREQLDAEPDSEVVAFAERLRLEPPPAAKAVAPRKAEVPALASTQAMHAEPVSPDETPTALPAPRRRGARAVMVTVALGLFAALTFAIAYNVRGTSSAADARSIGVLPFVNMSPDPTNTYFSDGLSEQIILALSRIDGLRVAARTSSFALRDRALGVRAIGDTLDVQAVLEGTVLADGERLRVIAQLIDARTGYHIWSDQYDGELRDVFAVQDSIAASIAGALHLQLAGDAAPPAGARTPGLEAYDLYLRGLHLRNGLAADGLKQAAEYFDRVIEMEPQFAEAIAAKASVIAPQAYFRYADRDTVVAQLRALTERALALDPNMGEAYVSLGILNLFYDWKWDEAGAALLRATQLNSSDAHAWHHLGNYYDATGSIRDALEMRRKAVQLDPLNARSRIVLSRNLLITGDYVAALENAHRSAQLDPLNPLLLGRGPNLPTGIAEILLRRGDLAEAVDEYVRVASLRGATTHEIQAMRDGYASSGMPGFWKAWLAMDVRQSGPSPDPLRMAITHVVIGDTAAALDWLDRAFEERSPGLIYIRRDPVLSGMQGHPRVQRIVQAMKFPN